ncbi:MAG: TetR/AcrR family transcriptional regulator [Solirubrobacteraceae bacterium]
MPTRDRLTQRGSRKESHEQIVEIQRARILEAMTEIVANCGLHGTTIAAVATQARVSRLTFAEIFGSIPEAFVALVEQVTEWPANLISDAFEQESSWRASVLAGLEALLVFLDSEPALARVCLVDALAGPPKALEHRAQLLEPLVALVDGVRETLPKERRPPAVAAEGAVVSVAGILHARLVSGQAPPFIDLLGELAELVVSPFLGPDEAAEAARISNRRAQIIKRERSSRPPDVRIPVPKQLHHARASRARACVLYIAEHPGASNQKIARGIGIRHLGQASTLLARLEELEMLTKQAGGVGRPNAWTLSPQGEQIVRSLKRR